MCWLWEWLRWIPVPALPADPKDLPVGFLSLVVIRGLLVVRDGLGTEMWDQSSQDKAHQGTSPTFRERNGIQWSGAKERNPCLEKNPYIPPSFILQNCSRQPQQDSCSGNLEVGTRESVLTWELKVTENGSMTLPKSFSNGKHQVLLAQGHTRDLGLLHESLQAGKTINSSSGLDCTYTRNSSAGWEMGILELRARKSHKGLNGDPLPLRKQLPLS